MKCFSQLFLLVIALGLAGTSTVRADYAYGSFGPPGGYYSCYRPWWGGLWGWGPWSGCSGYPAYKCSQTSGYRKRPLPLPARVELLWLPELRGGLYAIPARVHLRLAPRSRG